MQTLRSEQLSVVSSEDVVRVRQAVRTAALEIGLSLVDQTKVVTAASEIARNMIDYGGGGEVTIEILVDGLKRGVRMYFSDNGPGIANIEQAMTDGYTSGGGLGLGLSGAKRLVNDFHIDSAPGAGTRITLTRWKL